MLHYQINLITPPLYIITTSTLKKTKNLTTLNKTIANIKLTIKKTEKIFNIHKQILTTTTNYLKLYTIIYKLTNQNNKKK